MRIVRLRHHLERVTGDPIVNSSPTLFDGKLYIGSVDDAFPDDQEGRIYVFALP